MVFEKLREILAEQFDVDDIDTITQDTDIVADFDADSLDVVDLIMSIEDAFDIEVPDEAVDDMHTVGDVVRYIEEKQ